MTFNEYSDGQRTWYKIMLTKDEVDLIKVTKEQSEALNEVTEESKISDKIFKLAILAKLLNK